MRVTFRDRNAPSRMSLRYLEVLKHHERLSDIKKGAKDGFTKQHKADVFRGKIERSQV